MSSFFRVALKDSAAALSKQVPVFPTDGIMPLDRHRSRNEALVYWLPRSEWKTTLPGSGRRWRIAMVNASVTSSVRMFLGPTAVGVGGFCVSPLRIVRVVVGRVRFG